MACKIIIAEEELLRRLIREEFAQAVDARTRKAIERQENEGIFLTTKEVSEITGYDRSTIQRKIKEGIIPYSKKGERQYLFNKQEILDLQTKGIIKKAKSTQKS